MEDRINLNIDEENINIHIDETPSFTVEINPVEDVIIELNEQGPTGPRGFRGETGRGISNIELTNTVGLVDTYTIAYDDNTTSTFNITNGRDAIITSANATVNDTVGVPSVNVITNGTPYDRNFTFEFENLKGEQGIQGPQGERGPAGPQGPEGGTRAGVKGDYCTTYGIEYCQYGLITNPVGTKNITVKGGMMLCVPGAETKTTIGSDINYTVTSNDNVTIFHVDGNLLEASKVYFSIAEPTETVDGYIAWWNPDYGKWQFKSNDTGNVWRDGNATPLADIRIDNDVITRIDYIGYRVLNDDIYALKEDVDSTIDNLDNIYSNIDLSNLSNVGEKHFLNKSQITNCLLEVPQRIKYTLENGTLTIKAGSVVIVPYGTTDRTSEFTVGSKFVNNNFKVYDTQFANGKFFVWAELQVDCSAAPKVTDTNIRMVFVDLKSSNLRIIHTHMSGDEIEYTGTNSQFIYHTDTNIVTFHESTGAFVNNVESLPVCRVQADGVYSAGSVDQVFNGMGYIGSTKWVDKGVVGLATNGKNADGSLNNIEWKRNSILLKDVGATGSAEFIDIYTTDGFWFNTLSYTVSNTAPTIKTGAYWWYNPSTNEHFRSDGTNWVKMNATAIGSTSKVNGSIVSFTTKQPFRAVDYNDVQSLLNNIGDIGKPQISLDNNLPTNCIWLEGATVSRTTYAKLFELYGTTYGTGDGSTTFVLPDFRNRAIWGSNSFGYLSAGLPNITGQLGAIGGGPSKATGAFYDAGTSSAIANTGEKDGLAGFDASRSNAIYGKSNTVQPPAIKVRVYTKYQ